jgi:co-chaperonin GroES (HSP10)
MKFIPFPDKIEIRPLEKKGIIQSQQESFLEQGEVIAVGSSVTFVKPGDTICFDAWGCSKTPEIDGVQHYVVSESSQVILGKYEQQRVQD